MELSVNPIYSWIKTGTDKTSLQLQELTII